MSIDEVNRRLYVSRANSVAVIDIEKDALIGLITNTPGVHAVALAPDLNRGFTSHWKENKAGVVDLKTLEVISRIDTGPNPDAALYLPGQQEVYMFNSRGESVTIIDAKAQRAVTNISLGGHPKSAAADISSDRLYACIGDKNVVALMNTKSHEVSERWAVAPGQFPSAVTVDTSSHRLFVGCYNKLLLMLDSTNGKVVDSVPISLRVDAVAFDPRTQFIFASGGDGILTVAHEDSAGKLSSVQTLSTQPGARTMALDTKSHRIFVAAAKYEPPTKPQPGELAKGPQMIADSFGVLVYSMDK
jgi:YVTN family beta-propeller protein